MPIKTYNTKADFDADYDIDAEWDTGHPATRPGVRLGYARAVMWPAALRRAAFLDGYLQGLGYATNAVVLIVGAGYGWTAEAMETIYGWTRIVTTDTSPYIQSTQDADEQADYDAAITAVGLNPASGEGAVIKGRLNAKQGGAGNRRRHSQTVRDETLRNNGSRNRIKGVHGNIQVGISEEVITLLSDAEIVDLIVDIDAINASIRRIHMTTELLPDHNQDPTFNWKTLAQWKALLPGDTFISLNTWEVL